MRCSIDSSVCFTYCFYLVDKSSEIDGIKIKTRSFTSLLECDRWLNKRWTGSKLFTSNGSTLTMWQHVSEYAAADFLEVCVSPPIKIFGEFWFHLSIKNATACCAACFQVENGIFQITNNVVLKQRHRSTATVTSFLTRVYGDSLSKRG